MPSLVRTRPYNLIRHLHQRGHRITLVCLGDSGDYADLETLRPYLENDYSFALPAWKSILNCILAFPTSLPFQSVYSWNPRLAQLVNDLAGHTQGTSSFAVLHAEHLRGVRYALHTQQPTQHIPIVWDSVDSISHLFRQSARSHPRLLNRILLRMELARTEKYEKKLASQFERVLVTSQIDRQVYADLAPNSPVSILPNGVDLDYFHPLAPSDYDPNALVISGKMSYHPNIAMVMYMVEKIMPLVWATRPQTKLWVVGQNPSDEIRRACSDTRITVTGRVDDIRPYLQKSAAAAAPITYGAGIQNKVLEAMACGTPVVASPLAVSALSTQNEIDILVAEQPAQFASQLIRLMDQAETRRNFSEKAREYVSRVHSWDAIAARLEDIYTDVVNDKPSN